MSHVAKVKMSLKVTDLDVLEKACEKIGLQLVRKCSAYRYWANKMQKCSQKITIPGNNSCYEIGVIENGDGSYTFEWDTFGGGNGIVAKAGQNCSTILNAYKNENLRTQAQATASELGGFLSEYINEQGEQVYVVETY